MTHLGMAESPIPHTTLSLRCFHSSMSLYTLWKAGRTRYAKGGVGPSLLGNYRAKQICRPQRQDAKILVALLSKLWLFAQIELNSFLPVQLTCNRKVFSIII